MTQATYKEVIEQADYILLLAKKIRTAAGKVPKDAVSNRASGTIKNLAPELAKAASQIKQMSRYGWNERNF
jgi:hypothetical protein